MLQIAELPNHPYFIGVQFHPEFKSRPGKPSPLFLGTSLVHIIQVDFNLLSIALYGLHCSKVFCCLQSVGK